MSSVVYNCVHLDYVLTESWEITPVYDHSGTDVTHYLHRMSCQATVTNLQNLTRTTDGAVGGRPLATAGAALVGLGFAGPLGVLAAVAGGVPGSAQEPQKAFRLEDHIRHRLCTPRRHFRYTNNGVVVLESDGIDCANGPRTTATVRQMHESAWLVNFTIEVALRECDSGSLSDNWASLRYGQTVNYDHLNYKTHRTDGRVVFLSNAKATQNPEIAEQEILDLLPCPAGFMRHSQFTANPDGLGMLFTLTDIEQPVMPPSPSRRYEGTFVRSTRNGGKWSGEISIRLDGDKNCSKDDLIARCLQISMARLRQAGLLQSDVKPPQPPPRIGVGQGIFIDGLFGRDALRRAVAKRDAEIQAFADAQPKGNLPQFVVQAFTVMEQLNGNSVETRLKCLIKMPAYSGDVFGDGGVQYDKGKLPGVFKFGTGQDNTDTTAQEVVMRIPDPVDPCEDDPSCAGSPPTPGDTPRTPPGNDTPRIPTPGDTPRIPRPGNDTPRIPTPGDTPRIPDRLPGLPDPGPPVFTTIRIEGPPAPPPTPPPVRSMIDGNLPPIKPPPLRIRDDGGAFGAPVVNP